MYTPLIPSLRHQQPANTRQDAERLPEGFSRIGYDADTQTYTFRDATGNLYESLSGNQYGEMRPLNERVPVPTDAEIVQQGEAIKKGNREAVRMMLPFALLVFVFLILLFKLLYRSDGVDGDYGGVECGEGGSMVKVQRGDTCWEIAQGYGVGVNELLKLRGNEGIDCDKLRVGQGICVP
jgi:hypothetical protein